MAKKALKKCKRGKQLWDRDDPNPQPVVPADKRVTKSTTSDEPSDDLEGRQGYGSK